MTIFELIDGIADKPLFRGVDRAYVNRYLNESSMKKLSFSSGETAYSSTSGKIQIGILLSGSAQAYSSYASDSAEHTLLKTIRIGDIFGIANLYADQEPFPTLIISSTESEILFIDGEVFKDFIENDKIALRNFLSIQSRKIVYLNRKITTFSAGSSEKKLAVFMLDHEIDGTFAPPCSMSELADMLSIGRASLYRAIDNLEQYGWIKKKGKKIFINDRRALRAFV